MEYEDFELQIGPRSGAGCLVRVSRSPAGQGEGYIEVPEAPVMRHVVIESAEERISPTDMGGRLFRSLFSSPIGDLFFESLSRVRAESGGRGLRIRLRINPRDETLASLQRIPWELLYRRDTEDFLALSRLTPVVRSFDIPRPSTLRPLEPPLRILVILSQDPESPELDLTAELGRLNAILRRNPDVDIDLLENPDTRMLRRALSRTPFHALHFMGHGIFDPQNGEGALLFQGAGGTREVVTGRHLATKLKDFSSLRLVVLNACETARASIGARHNPFAGVAAALVLGGVPMVVAMQEDIGDVQAVAFSAAFYERLAEGFSVEEAVTEGRQAIHSLDPESTSWAIPVLFLRPSTGELFTTKGRMVSNRQKIKDWQKFRLGALAVSLLLLGVPFSGVLDPSAETASGPFTEWQPPLPEIFPTPETPPNQTKPKATSIPAAPAEVVTGTGIPRFEIVTASSEVRSVLSTALSREAERLTPFGATGWIIRLDVGPLHTETFNDSGMLRTTCRVSASCRARSPGTSINLGSLSASRADFTETHACNAAVETLAGQIIDKLGRFLKEKTS